MRPLREIIEAGAGCGKTTGLVDRYVSALGLHADPLLNGLYAPSTKRLPQPREILALTFTNEAARQMQERILKRLSQNGHNLEARTVREESQISTYHSFCLRLLQPYFVERGFEGALLSPALARFLRREYLIKALASYPEATDVRRNLSLPAILNIACDLWFHPLEKNPAEELQHEYEALEKRLKEFMEITQSKAEVAISAAISRDAKAGSDGWLASLVQALRNPSNTSFARINFTRGPKWIKQEYPELAEDAENLRDFFKDGYGAFLDPELRHEEICGQEALWNFLRWALPQAPKIFDFEAAEQELLKLLRENEGKPLMPVPRLILVDEFQDTNSVQYEILERISGDETEWYFVGDPKQSIYAFRGGDVSLFYRMRGELKHKSLDTNYRSHTRILELVNRVQPAIFRPQENPNDPHPQTLKWPADKGAGELSLHWLNSKDSTLDYTARLLLENRDHFEKASTAVLFRTWDKLYAFASILRNSGVSFRVAGSENPFNHILTDIFCAFLVSQDNEENSEGFWGLERWKNPRNFKWEMLARTQELRDEHRVPERGWSAIFQRFCEKAEIERFEASVVWVAAMERWLTASASEGLAARMSRTQLAQWLQSHRSELDAENPYRITPDEADRPGLTLLTLHGSKGLEFGHVYLPELFERSSAQRDENLEGEEGDVLLRLTLRKRPGEARRSLAYELRKKQLASSQYAEQNRLLYVALTRAIETLHVVGHTASDEKKKKDPLRVLGSARSNPDFWNRTLQNLSTSDFAITHLVEPRNAVPRAQDLEAPRPWSYPKPVATSPAVDPSPVFHRCGVSRYLKLPQSGDEDTDSPSRSSKHRRASFDFAEQDELGTDFHALLELWNGEVARLDTLLKSFNERLRPAMGAAANKLRELPELAPYWRALEKTPEQVQREFGVFLLSPEYRLSGFADVAWFVSESELCLIDWKSGASLERLRSKERLDKFRRQLALYASGFREHFPRIRIEVYGIELGETPRVARVFSEDLTT
jgi:ATP-dependent exoDNAse (exonuclease V) beta subunit